MTIKFHKGKHRGKPLYWLKWWPVLFNPVSIGRRVMFPFNAKYTLEGDDQNDHNKLFGVSFSLNPHRNSARFGWRYSLDKNKFILSAYCYVNGARHMEDICELVANRYYDCVLFINKDTYSFRVKQFDNGSEFNTVKISKRRSSKLCFLLGSYFGGNQPAPQAISIEMKSI